MNRFPPWKNYLVLFVVLAGILLSLPTMFGDDPAVHVTRADGAAVQERVLTQIGPVLERSNIEYSSVAMDGNAALVRFEDVEEQLRGNAALRLALEDHVVALTLAP